MLKEDEAAAPNSCWNKAATDEMVFVLLGRDPAAMVAICAWVEERIRIGKNARNDAQVVEAMAVAEQLRPSKMKRTYHPEQEKAMTGDEEVERLMASIDRYENAPLEEVEPDEYRRVLARYKELRMAGYGPQPYPVGRSPEPSKTRNRVQIETER